MNLGHVLKQLFLVSVITWEKLFEDVTEVVEPNEGSTRPKRSPKPNPKYSSDDYDLNYVGSKSRTRSQRSIRRAGHSSR